MSHGRALPQISVKPDRRVGLASRRAPLSQLSVAGWLVLVITAAGAMGCQSTPPEPLLDAAARDAPADSPVDIQSEVSGSDPHVDGLPSDQAAGDTTTADAGDGGVLSPPAHCAVSTTRTGPFDVTFRLMNTTDRPVYLHRGCVGLTVEIASCATRFLDSIGPSFACASCNCSDRTCTSNPTCGQCPQPIAVAVAPGASVDLPWQA